MTNPDAAGNTPSPTDPPGKKLHWAAKCFLAAPLAIGAGAFLPDDSGVPLSPVERQLSLDIASVLLAVLLFHAARKKWRNWRQTTPAACQLLPAGQESLAEQAGDPDFSRQFARIVASSLEPALIIAANGQLKYANQASRQLLGLPEQNVAAWSFSDLHDRWQKQLQAQAADDRDDANREGQPPPLWQGEGSIVNQQGQTIPVFETVIPHYDVTGQLNYWSVTMHDIRPEQEMKEALFFQATHDAQTGLPNLILFRDQIRQMSAGKAPHKPFCLAYISIDHFKQVNDAYGYETGDNILRQVGQRLADCMRQGDHLARINGDQFALLLDGVGTTAGASFIAERLFNAMRCPFTIGDVDTYLSICMGIALYPVDAERSDELIRAADVALNLAKRKGRSSLEFYHPDLDQQRNAMVNIEAQIRRGIEREEFVLAFQPQVRIADGQLIGLEALLRWRHPDLGLLGPEHFIPAAEESDLIIPLGQWALETACASLARWVASDISGIHVAVNLSARQFHDCKLLALVERVIAKHRINPGQLELEITESTMINDIHSTIATLNAFNAMGLSIAIDDFGTGYSSLSYLKKLPIDRLKIDRSFVQNLPADKSDAAIANTIIALAHHLDLKVIAEGVERPEQSLFLRDSGCDEVQGYLYGQPMFEEALLKYLQQGVPALAA